MHKNDSIINIVERSPRSMNAKTRGTFTTYAEAKRLNEVLLTQIGLARNFPNQSEIN